MDNEIARREPRYAVSIPVTLRSLLGNRDLFTGDVSYRGLFLRTELPLTKRQLLRVELRVPTQEETIETSVVVANVGAGVSPGAGVSFYGLHGDQRAGWDRFIQFAREQPAARAPRHGSQVPPEELVVHVASGGALERLSREIARGSLVVQSHSALDVDAPVSVRIVHPVTHGDFHLTGVVRRRTGGGEVMVSLPCMDSGTHARLTDFVDSGVDFEGLRPPPRRTHAA
jgi:hypothetical protein